ncbi:MAG TPA: tetratricopeptide repeat protein [Pseudonocardiaceae bacterium]|nr:tetratricopeptide repeat protein [Pseudonocardiaceae bacterium]
MLAVLLVEANRFVSVDQLMERVWGDAPPQRGRGVLYSYLSRLRSAFADEPDVTIERRSGGYLFAVDEASVDLHQFRGLVDEARLATDDGHALALFDKALGLWRGSPFADLDTPWLASVRAALEMQRSAAELDRTDAALRCGQHAQLLADLNTRATQQPFDERIAGQLMLALAGAGRQAEALTAYQHTRRALLDQLGLEPGAELRRLHERILAGTTAADTPGPGDSALPDARRQLPAPPAQFIGRATELDMLGGLVSEPGTEPPGTVVISAIDGMPGVGKTALALRFAHLVADRYPDRQMYVDLHGHTPGQPPTDPADALAALLTADGVDARYLPGSPEGRAALWRDRMAGRRVLLVLDNAASSGQIKLLLPGTAMCLVLITSRQFLGDLPSGTAELQLNVLPAADAIEMFLGLAPRAADAMVEVAELVTLCEYLPLAITLLARLLTRHPAWSMGDLISRTRAQLLTVRAENHTVAAAFELSYRALDPDQQRFFRHLGLHPGIDIDPYAAAALADVPLDVAAGHLDTLHAHRLLEEMSPERFRMHDLIRRYARTLTEADDPDLRDRAVGRLLDYYRFAALAAGSHVARRSIPTGPPTGSPTSMPDLSGWKPARAWMTAERPNLVACIEDAATRGDLDRQVALTAAIAAHLRIDGPWSLGIQLHAAAAAAAQRSDDQLGRADALVQLGDLRRLTGDYPGATDDLEQARAIYAGVGNRIGESNALLCLGEALRATGDLADATVVLEQAQSGYAVAGDLPGEVNVLLVLGTLRQLTSAYPAAVDALTSSMMAARRAGSRLVEAEALRNLGALHNLTGDLAAATHTLEQALSISTELDDRLGAANAMSALGRVRQDAGDPTDAVTLLERALVMFQDLGSGLGAARALGWLGDAVRATGDLPRATTVLQEALTAFDKIGHRHGAASTLQSLGQLHHDLGDLPAAEDLLIQARDIYHDVCDALGEAQTLNQIGTLRLAGGQPGSARLHHVNALAISESSGIRAETDRAREGIRRCDAALATDPA